MKQKAVAGHGCRVVAKADLKLNNTMPDIEVDTETFQVKVDGKELQCTPAEKLPLAQLYNMF